MELWESIGLLSTVGLLTAAPLLLVTLVARLVLWGRRRRLTSQIEALTEPLSLRRAQRGFVGSVHGVPIGLRLGGHNKLEVVVTGPRARCSPDLQIGAGHARFPTGDPRFDQEVDASGLPPAELLALAEPGLRERLVPAVQAGLTLRERRWRARLSAREANAERLLESARAIAVAHGTLEEASERATPLRLALLERLSDPHAGVRRQALALVTERGWADERVLAPLLRDLDPELRVAAATALGRWEILLDLVQQGSRTWKLRAARILVRRRAPLRDADRRLIEDVALGALPDPELSALAAELLVAVGSSRALPGLEALASTGSKEARMAANQARAAIGARMAAQAGTLSQGR